LLLPAANESDIARAEALLADRRPGVVIADTGYDKKGPVDEIESRGAEAVIPTLANRTEQREVAPHLYRERNVCERFGAQAQQFRRVATRYEKKARNVLAFAWVAAVVVMLK
jgi:transposase